MQASKNVKGVTKIKRPNYSPEKKNAREQRNYYNKQAMKKRIISNKRVCVCALKLRAWSSPSKPGYFSGSSSVPTFLTVLVSL